MRQDERVLYGVLHRIVPPLLRAVWRPHVNGLEHVPRTGPLILASNHQSFIDSVVIPAVAPRPVSFLAKSDYFEGRGIKGRLVKAWFEMFGALPVDRDDSKAALASLDPALSVLAEGGAFGIYPEGTRSRDGRLYRGRPASPSSHSPPVRRSCRSACSTPTGSSRWAPTAHDWSG